MIKLVIKLGLAALIANAAWQSGQVFAAHYNFSDQVRQAALVRDVSEGALQQRILELAAEGGIPLEPEGFTIRREDRHVYVQGAYERPIPVMPSVDYPWRFTFDVDAYVIEPPKLMP